MATAPIAAGPPVHRQGPIKRWKQKELAVEPTPPLRPKVDGTGTVGKCIRLKANYFEVKVNDWNKNVVHYDVVIKQPGKGEDEVTLSKRRKLEIFESFKNANPAFFSKYKIGYDGMKSAVSVGIIPEIKDGVVHKVHVTNNSGRQNLYHVILKVVNQKTLTELRSFLRAKPDVRKDAPATVFQLIEIMFRHTPSTEYISIGQNSFFAKEANDPFGKTSSLGNDMEAVQGFFASLRPASWKNGSLLLNVDVAHVVFYKEQTVLEFMRDNGIITMQDYMSQNVNEPLDRRKIDSLKKKLVGLKVRATHSQFRRTYKVIDIMPNGADQTKFNGDDGNLVSVTQYFRDKYPRARLRFPKLNVIRAAPENKTVYLPIEVCMIAKGQKVKRQNIDPRTTASFISFTAKPPRDRLKNIVEIPRNRVLTENDLMRDLGFTFSDEPIELTGRVLPPPELVLKGEEDKTKVIKPYNGKWDIKDQRFFISKDINNWVILNYHDRLDEGIIWNFVERLIEIGNFRGMRISQPQTIKTVYGWKNQKPKVDLNQIKEDHPSIELLMVILFNKSQDSHYANIKKIGDRELHVPTQCVLSHNVCKPKPATIGNLLFKMNAKMGGVNVALSQKFLVLDKPVMVMGADVNHPPASDKSGTPSIAAVVGSLDKFAFKYAVEVRPQTSRREMIEKMKEMTINLLKSFYRVTGSKPERLIMYRDGVSESQFLEVLSYELKAMRAACTYMNKEYQPGITFIVVQKRHHTRFFPVNDREGVGKNKNVPPGTIVDTAVTHPTDIDFFLCSHEGIQGTSKPTHYRVLWDDNDLTIDQLQEFSFAMCHLYARCARSVSSPTPAYYAHWAAYRGKTHLHGLCGGATKPSEQQLLEAVKMDMMNEVNRRMYFL